MTGAVWVRANCMTLLHQLCSCTSSANAHGGAYVPTSMQSGRKKGGSEALVQPVADMAQKRSLTTRLQLTVAQGMPAEVCIMQT